MHADAFQDTADAWPPWVNLEGFHYDALGSQGGTGRRDDMRRRLPEEWGDWLARNRVFSTQPYSQLSTVLSATRGKRFEVGRAPPRSRLWWL
jgi:hypothetical protein